MYIGHSYQGIFENLIDLDDPNISITTLLYKNENFNSPDSTVSNMIIDIILEENKDFINQFLNQK